VKIAHRVSRIAQRGVLVLIPAAALPVLSGFASPAAEQLGVWEAKRVNNGPLPMTDQVVGRDSLTHAVRLHGMTIRLMKNGRFSAALKFRRAILSKKEKIETQPLQNDTWVGSYTEKNGKMHFVPEKHGDQVVQPFDGVSAGRRITISFDYEIVQRKHYVLDLDKNDNIFSP
jgi:hypothetical protein